MAKRIRRYLLMEIKFMRGEEYGYGNCGIPEDSKHYQPKLLEKISIEDRDYLECLEEIIKTNNSIKGRKYDTIYYLADGRYYYGARKDKFMEREFQELLMEDFFDTEEYINALGKTGVLSNIKPNKLKQNINIKYCSILQPYHYTSLGIYRLDPLALDDIKEAIQDMEFNINTSKLNDCTGDITDCLKPNDSKEIQKLINEYRDSHDRLVKGLKDLVDKLDDDGYYK